LSHERYLNAGAEAVLNAEGNMSGAAMRGTAALPGSETSSRTKGNASEPGRPHLARGRNGSRGPRREVEETKPSRKR
jgi:hypothetical protein